MSLVTLKGGVSLCESKTAPRGNSHGSEYSDVQALSLEYLFVGDGHYENRKNCTVNSTGEKPKPDVLPG